MDLLIRLFMFLKLNQAGGSYVKVSSKYHKKYSHEYFLHFGQLSSIWSINMK